MNCKQGDLAVFVSSRAGNEGRIVTCLRFVGALPGFGGADYWVTDLEITTMLGDRACIARDSQLRPIRDPGEDARDETLNWLPVPVKETA